MRILHMMLAAFYIDGYNYQENALPRQNKADGHEVEIIASTFSYDKNGQGYYLQPSEYINEDGIRVIRLPYRADVPYKLRDKINAYPGVGKLIEAFNPDMIFFHNLNSSELHTAAMYKRFHPGVKLFADTHADYYTSGTNWVSLKLLHGVFNRLRIKRSLPYIDKVYYISQTCGKFLHEVYRVPVEMTEFLSLGGTVEPAEQREKYRVRIRAALGLSDEDIMLVHAGKLNSSKRTLELLNAVKHTKHDNVRLYIIGSLSDDIKDDFISLVEEIPYVYYLGWKSSEDLKQLLCACDIYVQPGKVSAIAQNALCCGAAVILKDWPDYEPFINGNGWLVGECRDITDILDGLDALRLPAMRRASLDIAECYLDYSRLAARFTGS